MGPRSSLVLIGAAAAAGCSVLTSLDGLSDPADPAGGRAPTADAEAGLPAKDGGSEAGSFCQGSVAHLCVDFEDGAPLASYFGELRFTNGATGELVTDEGPPASRALALTVPITSGSLEASCRASLPSEITRAVIQLDLRILEIGGGEPFDFIGLYRSNAREISLELDDQGTLKVDEDYPDGDGGEAEKKTPLVARIGDRWARLRWEIVKGSSDTTHTFFVNDVEVGDTKTSNAILQGASLVVGERAVNGVTKRWRVLLDNILVDIASP